MNDLFTRVHGAFRQRTAEFLKIELETCSRSVTLASMMYQAGNRNSAERTIADAEQGYATVLRFLSDPQYSKSLTIKATQEFTAKMKGLRKALDAVQRLRTSQLQTIKEAKGIRMEKQWKTTTARDSEISTTGLEKITEPENQHEVAALAYEFWQARGCPEGTPEEDWFRAEKEIATSKKIVQKEMVQKATA